MAEGGDSGGAESGSDNDVQDPPTADGDPQEALNPQDPRDPRDPQEALKALAEAGLPEQLAGMTQSLQAQLAAITQEMNALKGELYSEQGGLASKLAELSQRAGDLDAGSASASTAANPPNDFSAKPSPAASERREPSGLKPSIRNRPAGTRQVEWEPGTRDPLPRRPMGRAMPPRRQPPQQAASWTPYIVGFTVLCIGPMRPLVWELVSQLYALVSEALPWSNAMSEPEVPWYDQ